MAEGLLPEEGIFVLRMADVSPHDAPFNPSRPLHVVLGGF